MQSNNAVGKGSRVLTIIIIVLIVLCLIGVVGIYVLNSKIKEDAMKTYTQIKDSSLLSCESCVMYTDDLCLLYAIGDEATYRKAKSAVRMSDKVQTRFFTADTYVGEAHDYTCKIVDVQYTVPEYKTGLTADATYTYYVTLQQIDNATGYSKIYNLIAVYTDGRLCDLITL